MKSAPKLPPLPRSAELADVYRLWQTLRMDLRSDLQIIIEPLAGEGSRGALAVQVITIEPPEVGATPIQHVWAQKIFYANGYNISWGQLFDLLIHAYYAIEEDLKQQLAKSARPRNA